MIDRGKVKIFELTKTVFNFSTAFDPNISFHRKQLIDIPFISVEIKCNKRQLLVLKKMVRKMFFKKLVIYTEFCVIC